MDNQTYQCSAYFKLYGKDNLQIAFNVCENDPDTHRNLVEAYIEDLFERGYSVEPQGLEAGEEIREVQGWVLGWTSKDEPCVYLYGPEYLEYKTATVWAENIADLPIDLPEGLKPWQGSAPTREMAEKNKVFHPAKFKVVMEPRKNYDGSIIKTEKGNVSMQFSRIYGMEKRVVDNSDDKEVDFHTNGKEKEEGPVERYPEIVQSIYKNTGKPMQLLQWARKEQLKLTKGNQDKSPATSEKLTLLTDVIDDILQAPSSGAIVLSVLSGKDAYDLDEIDGWIVDNLLERLPEYVDVGGEIKENPSYNKDTNLAILGIWKEAQRLLEDA